MPSSAEQTRAYSGPAFFSRGFRPFFLSAALFAGIVMPIWSMMLAFDVSLPTHLSGRNWHLHEMIYGYTAAIIAGFLLTAVPNWTGRLPVLGTPLTVLWGTWVAGRIAMGFSELSPIIAAIIDSAFLVLFALVILREIIAGKNRKNLPVVLIISLLALSNIAFHIHWLMNMPTDMIERASLGLIALLIALIGGRVVPSFTRNWMARKELSPLPASMDRLDKTVMAIGVITVLAWIFAPYHSLTGIMFTIAALGFLLRMYRWRGLLILTEPLVAILHIGYLWLPVWFALMALAILGTGIIDYASALHALSAGAIGTMTMAMATRATLGHSGQPLVASKSTIAIYMLITLGALMRICVNWLPFDYTITVSLAGLLWAAGMIVFVVSYGPLLTGKQHRL